MEALEARVRREYPERDSELLGPGEPLDVRPEGARSVALLLRRARVPEPETELAVERLSRVGSRVRGRAIRRRPDVWQVDVTLGPEELLDPGAGTPADVVVVDGVERLEEAGPPIAVAAGAALVVGSTRGAAPLWADMPLAWRALVRGGGLRLVRADAAFEAQLDAAAKILAGEAHGAEDVDWTTLDDPPDSDRVLPLAVRRFDATGTTYDNVSRFWGEYAQPLEHGVRAGGPDPYLALGAMPVCSSTFRDRTPRRERHPVLDPALCTGCGACWTACPDSAIAPVALGLETLLGAAVDRAGIDGEVAAKLRRAQRQLVSRTAVELEQSAARRWTDEPLRAAYERLRPKLPIGDEKGPAVDAAVEAVAAELSSLPLSVPDAFFGEAERERKGSGELLLLGFNPQACQACGACAAVCPEDAVRIVPQTSETLEAMRRSWEAWERLPDTPGASIERAMRHPRIGPLAGLLLSRHCLFTVAGGDHAEPGSGERVAVRQVAAVLELRAQQRALERIAQLDRLSERLHDGVRAELTRAVAVDDLDRLARDLAAVPHGFSELVARFESTPGATSVDRPRLEALVASARAIDALRKEIAAGELGIGRSRFGLVLAGSVADWAAHFPRNPFSVPVTVDLDAHGADTAIGVLEGLRARVVDEARAVRRAERLLDGGADVETDERPSDADLLAAPTLLVVARAGDLGEGVDLDGLSRLLTSGLPVRVLLLDSRGLGSEADPGLLALAHREAFVLSASISEPGHLYDGVLAALDFDGPALVHVHAPVPQRDGYSTERTVERARMAVASRVHPLYRYDPRRPGVFGLRIDLAGNPDLEARWGRLDGAAVTPAHWAARETRFAAALRESARPDCVPVEKWYELSPEERRSATPGVTGPDGRDLVVGAELRDAVVRTAERWATLQELAGVVTPFVDSLRREIASELEAGHEAEVAALRAEHETRIAQVERSDLERQTERLRERLLELAGYGQETRA